MNGVSDIRVSIVIPVHNEEESAPILCDKILQAMRAVTESYEVVFVDDGSTDATFDRLRRKGSLDERIKIIKFRSNYGQSAAMAAGFKHAKGEYIISMDGDLQNDPRDIGRMIHMLGDDCDMICGWRRRRKDTLILRKIPSKIANYLIRMITRVNIHDTGCSLRAYKSGIVKRIALYGELHRFIPALCRIEGARIKEVEVNHHSRMYGTSKYSIIRTVKVLMDMTTMSLFIRYLNNPMKYFGAISLFLLSAGAVATLLYAMSFMIESMTVDERNVILIMTFLFVTSGIQYIIYGFLAEIVTTTSKYIITRR